MASYITLPTKINTTTLPTVCDFGSQLAAGEAVTACTVTCTVFVGTDANPSAVISGAATISQNIVTQIVTAGTPGVIYLLSFNATTNFSNYLIIYAYLAVTNSTPFLAIP